MRILVTGAKGMIGSELVPYLLSLSHEVCRLTRRSSEKSDIAWNPDSGSLDSSEIEGFGAIVHLAGENIASGAKSLAFHVYFRSHQRTLTAEEVNRALQGLLHTLEQQVGASLRT